MSGWVLIILMSWPGEPAKPVSVAMVSEAECRAAMQQLVSESESLTGPRVAVFCIKGAR